MLSDLAPLHNSSALAVIKACLDHLPHSKSVAVFDTTFHQSIPAHISTYAISPSLAQEKSLKKYGFHGLSYSYILRSVSTFIQRKASEISIIALHLGSGASMCAIQNGKSCDTTMGLTPLDGLPGATRSGSVDPSLVFHCIDNASQIGRDHLSAAEEMLNKQSGWKALTGTTDFKEIASNADVNQHFSSNSAHPAHTLAFHLFLDRILNYFGAYFLKLGGASKIDAIVFAGGVGERSAILRKAVVERCRCFGLEINEEKNEDAENVEGNVVDITGDGEARTRVFVCRTDEQVEMANSLMLHMETISAAGN